MRAENAGIKHAMEEEDDEFQVEKVSKHQFAATGAPLQSESWCKKCQHVTGGATLKKALLPQCYDTFYC